MRKLVDDIWPITPEHTRVVLRAGFNSIGWNADANTAATNAPPSAQTVLTFMGKALQKLGATSLPSPGPSVNAAPVSLLTIAQDRAEFVRSRLASGKIPNGAQLADFLRKFVIQTWPVAQRNAREAALLENNLLRSVGWNVKTNRATSQSPPSPQMLLRCIDTIVEMLGGERRVDSISANSASTEVSKPGPPMQPQVTAAGVKIFPNAGFNMDDYTTKLDKSALSDAQIREAERLAREIEGEKRGSRRGGWDEEGDSGMVSWE